MQGRADKIFISTKSDVIFDSVFIKTIIKNNSVQIHILDESQNLHSLHKILGSPGRKPQCRGSTYTSTTSLLHLSIVAPHADLSHVD